MPELKRYIRSLAKMSMMELWTVQHAIELEVEQRGKRIEIPERADRRVVEERTNHGVTLRLEYVRCGKCKVCAAAPAHGPYWYRYFRAGGKLRSEYIGKNLKKQDTMNDLSQVSDKVRDDVALSIRKRDAQTCGMSLKDYDAWLARK
jgi:hypothetical protein